MPPCLVTPMPRNDPQQNGDHESPTTSLEADMKQLELGNALQPTTTMHDHQEDLVRRIRNEITKLLELCLQKTQDISMSNDDNDSQQPSPALSRLARVLEQRLYSSAKNCAEYCDTTTLESRLRTVLQQRRIQRLRSHTQPQRQLFLKQRLGLDKFHQLDQLVTQIQQEKNELVGQSCPNCQFRGPKLNTAFEAKLPIPVQLLFFDTPLVDVFRKYSISRLTAQQDFRRLEQQAQQHLSEFQTWKMQNDVCEIQK